MNEKYVPHSEEEAREDEEMLLEEIVEAVPEEKREEIVEKAKKLAEPKPVIGSLEALKGLFSQPTMLGKGVPTSPHSAKKRGVGITRKNKSKSKSALKAEKNSRKINRGKK